MNRPTNVHELLTQNLVHQLQSLYQSQLGHQPNHISCKLQDTTLAIVIEHPLTKVEQLLMTHGCRQLTERIRSIFDRSIQIQLIPIIEKTVDADVVDLLINTHLEANQASAIVILASSPSMVLPAMTISSSSPRSSDSQSQSNSTIHSNDADGDADSDTNDINANDDE